MAFILPTKRTIFCELLHLFLRIHVIVVIHEYGSPVHSIRVQTNCVLRRGQSVFNPVSILRKRVTYNCQTVTKNMSSKKYQNVLK